MALPMSSKPGKQAQDDFTNELDFPRVSTPLYGRHFQGLFDDNLLKPPPSPLAPSRDLELMNFVETDDSFIPNYQTSSTGQSFTLGEASDTSSSIQRLNLLEVDNCYLLEQNRLLKKELLHNKLNVESVKKVITQKEVCLSQLQGDRNKLEERVKKLEESLDWIKANVNQSILASSPFSPLHPESSSSLTLSNVSEGSLSDRPESQPKDPNDVKTRRRSDSINFVRGLFKLNGKAKSKSKEGEDWVNCDEGITVENVKPTLNNTPLRSIKASKYGKKQTKILSALRFSSGGAIGSLPLSSECQTTREELRSQIFFKDSSPLPAKGTLPSGISQKSVVATPPSPECPPKDDIEVELFDLEPKEFSDHGSPRYSPPPSESNAVKDAVNPAEYTFPFSDASDSSNKIINSSTDSSDLTPAALSLHALAKQAEKESILGRQLALPSSIVLTMKPENDDLSASQSLSADLERSFSMNLAHSTSSTYKHLLIPADTSPSSIPLNKPDRPLPSLPPEATLSSPIQSAKSSTFPAIKKASPIKRRSSARARPASMPSAASSNPPAPQPSRKGSQQPSSPGCNNISSQLLPVAQ